MLDQAVAEIAATERAVGAAFMWWLVVREHPEFAAAVASGGAPWAGRLVSACRAGLELPDVYGVAFERCTGIPVHLDAVISDPEGDLMREIIARAWVVK